MQFSTATAAGLVYGPDGHHLDHLAPICLMMGIPLLVTETEIADDARKYYPDLNVIDWDYLETPHKLVERFEWIFCSLPRELFDELFFIAQKSHRKKVKTIWCPHGNSDKGASIYFMEALRKEQAALVYGQKMIDFLKEKESFDSLKTCVQTGNFRRMFFEKEKTFYRALATKEIFSYFENKGTTVLYAPTWQDYENSSSFFDAAPILIDNLPSHFNLIVKLHPNAVIQDTHRIEQLIWKYEDRTNVLFLIDFPPIYPLLECVDIYIGDMSSIGYDFLSFNRPMFFLNQNRRDPKEDPGLYLYRCGVEIRPEQYADIYKIIDIHLPTDHLVFSEIRKEVYDYTFASGKTWEGLKEEISEACNAIADDDLIFM